MESRSNASARRSPMPFRNLIGVSRWSTAIRLQPSAFGIADQVLRELCRIEHLEVVGSFPGAEEANRQRQLVAECHQRASPRGAVQLGDDEPGRRDRLGEQIALMHRVLSHRAIEYQQGIVGRDMYLDGGDPN